MKSVTSEQWVMPDESDPAKDNSPCSFNIAVVYQDALTEDWARQLCGPVTQKFGAENVRHTWHNVNSLSEPGVRLQAVRAALTADVIVVSIHAADELPLELYAWITAWLPRRISRVGTLAALIGVARQPDSQAARTHQYLQAVARRGQLDFIPYEHRLEAEPGAGSAQPVRTTTEPARYIRLTANGQTEFRF